MKNILLIGKNSYLSRSFASQYRGLFNFYSTSSSPCSDSNVFKYNLCDSQLPVLPKISHAIIFAGISNINKVESHKNLAYKLNFEGTSRLIRQLNKKDIKTLFLSSSAVFANSSNTNHEDASRYPSTYYGYLKKLVEDVSLSNNLNAVVRLSKCFDNNSIIAKWADMLRSNHSIQCFDDLLISPVPTSIVSNMINDWLNGNTPIVTHLSSSSYISYYQFGKLLANHLQKDSDLVQKTTIQSLKSKPLYTPINPCLLSHKYTKYIINLNASIYEIFKEIC